MLINEKYILEDKEAKSKVEIFQVIINNLKKNNVDVNEKEVLDALNDRESQVSTGFEHGIAIPHAKINGIQKPIVTVVKTNNIDWPSMDGKPTDFVINILVPLNGADDHLKILSQLTRKLIDINFIESLKKADKKEIAEMLNDIKVNDKEKEIETKNKQSYVAVTSCPMGVAHTYMAAESLEKYGKENGYNVKVETQGTVGAENVLTDDDIQKADFVIIAADRKVEFDRFADKKMVEVGTKEAINTPEKVVSMGDDASVYHGQGSKETKVKGQNEIMKALMNGVSHMLPLVVVGGLFLGLSLAFGGVNTSHGRQVAEGTFWGLINQIGTIGFTLMIPVLAGYIAYSIGDRAALVPGLIIGWISNDPTYFGGGDAKAGFLGAIIGGLMVGYFVKYFAKLKIHKNLQSLMPILVIPIVTTFVTSAVFIYVIGQPIAWLFGEMNTFLGGLPANQKILIGALLGFMIAIDMGGPINKTAMLFAIGMIPTHPEFMGINAVAVATPSIGIGIATLIRRKYYNKEEQSAGIASFVMGLAGITEGAIPFAASHPKQMFPANIIGAMIGGIIAAAWGITNTIPHGGVLIALTGGVNKPWQCIVTIFIGAIVTALIANVLMARDYKKQQETVK